jgi:hypothetical protein
VQHASRFAAAQRNIIVPNFQVGRQPRWEYLMGIIPHTSLSPAWDCQRGRQRKASAPAGSESWRAEGADAFITERHEFRLIVCLVKEIAGCARFLVVRRGSWDEIPDTLIGSGTMNNMRAAMAAAEGMAERCTGLGSCRED